MADMIASDSSDNQMHITGGETPYVVMPCDLNDFQKFVSGLLGKPQEIVSDTEGQFNIKHRDISNIYHLITHRVDKQNEAKLIQARITVHYSNGDSVTHHNVQDFESYHPIANCFPAAVTIDFSYLIKFQNKDVPEKQEITVSISTDPEIAPINSQRWFRTGLFSYRIRHTERTWATDIAGLLTSHADSIIQKHGFISNFLYEKLDELTTYLSMLVLILSILIWSMYTFKYLGQVDSFINLSTL